MPDVVSTVNIRRPLEAVFSYVTTPGNWPAWHPSSLGVSGATDHSLAVGEQVTEEYLVAGGRGTAVWTVVDRHAPYRWSIDGTVRERASGGTVTYELSPDGEGTRFVRTFSYRLVSPAGAPMDDSAVRPLIQAESDEAVRRLKAVLEGGEA